jgi:hypothetical protein
MIFNLAENFTNYSLNLLPSFDDNDFQTFTKNDLFRSQLS